MKRIYTVLIALSSLVVGFALSSFYSKSSAPVPMSPYNFLSNSSVIRIVKGTKTSDNSYYLNILNYGMDSITVTSLDSINLRCGIMVSYSGGSTYQFTASHSGLDSVPRSVYKGTSCILVDSTIYSRLGVIYGRNTDGTLQSFNSADVISVQGGVGTVVFGIMPIDVYE